MLKLLCRCFMTAVQGCDNALVPSTREDILDLRASGLHSEKFNVPGSKETRQSRRKKDMERRFD